MVDADAEYEVYQGRHSGTKRSEINRKGINALKAYADVIGAKATMETILAAVGYKHGTLVTQPFPDDAAIDRFVETLNAMGVTCAVDRQDPEAGKRKTCILLTRDESYSREDFEEISRLKEEDANAYHRELGEFLGYPGPDIESFIERGRTPPEELEATGEYRTGIMKRGGTDMEEPEIAWTQPTKNSVFNAYAPSADPEALEEYERRAGTRFRAVQAIEQAYGIDLHDLSERYARDLSGSVWGEER